MNMRARIDDATFLWKHGHKEGAFLMALVAIAATSRLRFPNRKAVSDGDAFEQFLTSVRPGRIGAEYRGEMHSVEHIFYKWLRCALIHESGLPEDIKFMPDIKPGTFTIRAGGAPEYVLKLSNGWFNYLIDAVVTAPENAAVFSNLKR
ncbi:MAG: hypothetical protein PHQ60_03775 [Sideroxydans sp.]|nr:hypothetical protein [Sideroxydans sp.]